MVLPPSVSVAHYGFACGRPVVKMHTLFRTVSLPFMALCVHDGSEKCAAPNVVLTQLIVFLARAVFYISAILCELQGTEKSF
jgi:hypothetical protein